MSDDDELERELLAMHNNEFETTRAKRTLESAFTPPDKSQQRRSVHFESAIDNVTKRARATQSRYSIRPSDSSMAMCGAGQRVFVRVHDEFDFDGKDIAVVRRAPGKSHLGLLETPITELLRNIDTKARLRRQQDEIVDQQPIDADPVPTTKPQDVESALWVEKYAPRSFTELLSDEQVNRRALQWLKSWDAVVFPERSAPSGVVPPKRAKTTMNAAKAEQEADVGDGADDNDGDEPKGAAVPDEDDDRPHFKVLLLSGPPGVAKTTLAHILALHCGYEPIEINASDDRGAKQFSERLLDVVQSRRTLSSNKPSLLILDEIDGSLGADGRGAIGELIKVIRGYKAKSGTMTLRRPIICICNDKFALPLRDLRPLCMQLDLEAPRSVRLVRRLASVAQRQGLQCDDSILATLVESTRGDIRQSLTALQWAARAVMRDGSKVHRVRLHHFSLADSSKDFTTSLFDAWRAIATSQSGRAQLSMAGVVDVLANTTQAPLHERSQFDQLFDMLSTHSDDVRLINGVHEQMLSWRYTDPTLDRTAQALDWLVFAADADAAVSNTMSFGLRKFSTCALLAVRHLCAVPMPPRLVYPVGEPQLRQATTRHSNAIAVFAIEYLNAMALIRTQQDSSSQTANETPTQRVRASVLPSTQALTCVALEMASSLANILVPRIRAVNKQLLRQTELALLQRTAALHVALGLKFSLQSRQSTSKIKELMLDPPIVQLAVFDGDDDSHRIMPDEVVRMVQQEMYRERLVAKEVLAKCEAIDAGLDPSKIAPVVDSNHYVPVYSKQMAVLAGGGESKSAPKVVKRDFFGRVVEPKSAAGGGVALSDDALRSQLYPVVFTFHEGFSNAVRRPVFVKEWAPAATATTTTRQQH